MISFAQPKEFISFPRSARSLFIRTAAVRWGIKSGELLPVRRFFSSDWGVEGEWQEDVLKYLGLRYFKVRELEESSLYLFYHPFLLVKRLMNREILTFLSRYGYRADQRLDYYFSRLGERFNEEYFPHEVGIFLGYPLKDVWGFIREDSPTLSGRWQVYGDPQESLTLMRSIKEAENFTAPLVNNSLSITEAAETLAAFIDSPQNSPGLFPSSQHRYYYRISKKENILPRS